MAASTAEQLLAIVAEETGVPVSEITPASTWEALGMDSLDFICMVKEIRDKVGPLSDLQASRCATVGDVIDLFPA